MSFKRFQFHVSEQASSRGVEPAGFEPAMAAEADFTAADAMEEAPAMAAAPAPEPVPVPVFNNDEAAARFFMDGLWTEAEGPLFEITAPEAPALVPDLQLRRVQESPETKTRLLHFSQNFHNVPVMGSKAVVELMEDRSVMSVDAQIAEAPSISAIATVSPEQALTKIAEAAKVPRSALKTSSAPRLTFYKADDDVWHLVYEVRDVPAAPPEFLAGMATAEGHGLAESPRQEALEMTYLVDANDGSIVLYYSETPWIDVPVICKGVDELASVVELSGAQNATGDGIELRDPVRKIRTFDLAFGNLTSAPLPPAPVTAPSFDFQKTNTAAISAHRNATLVFDFYNDVLKRDGVDDRGMELISIVNCTYKPPASKDWKNAVWFKQRMWYGQVDQGGGFASYSRHLDVIAHELTHGVVETTAALQYLGESGALNESFCDLFGVIVKNLNGPDPGDLAKWDWELGSGLKSGNRPLRDLSDPKKLNYPDHMDNYVKKPDWDDSGGVHTNSNIHNKAAFNVLTSKKSDGTFLFAPRESALIFYLALTRLSSLSKFADVLAALHTVIRSRYLGRPDEIALRVDAVTAAYEAVGIRLT